MTRSLGVWLTVCGAMAIAPDSWAQDLAPAPSAAPTSQPPPAPQPGPAEPSTTQPASTTPPVAPQGEGAAKQGPADEAQEPLVEQVEAVDRPMPKEERAAEVYEPPVPPPPTPLRPDEIGALTFALGFGSSFGDIDKAFPWGFNAGFGGSLRVVKPLHATLGIQLSVLHLRNAGSTGYLVCNGYSCGEETESGTLITLPLGIAWHIPVAQHRILLGAGGLYSWYSATTFQNTGVREGPGAFGRVTWSIPGFRSIYYELFADGSVVWSAGERFVGRIPSETSTDFWLGFGLAVRFLL